MVVFRLAELQIIDADRYLRQAEQAIETRGRSLVLETVRGSIYDCHGRRLAIDEPTFDICLHYKLTRLYDERFWQYQRLKFDQFDARAPSAGQLRRHLRREFNLPAHQVKSLLENIAPGAAEPLGPLRKIVLDKADALLAELAWTCDVGMDKLLAAIRQVNDRVYIWQAARARRIYYREHSELSFKSADSRGILADLARLVGNADRRAALIGATSIAATNDFYAIVEDVGQEIALAVEQSFVGVFVSPSGRNRPVCVRVGKRRCYPCEDVGCHLIGQIRRVGAVSASEDVGEERPSIEQLTAYRRDDRRGAWGIERVLESVLRGRRGWVRYDIDDNQVERIEPQKGSDIHLTIDIELQKTIQGLFNEKDYYGSAVLIDVATGAIRAAVSVPTFDLNTYYHHEDHYERINQQSPPYYYLDRSFAANYQPGSTIKPILLLGALQTNVLDAAVQFDCAPANKDWPGAPHEIHNHGLTAAHDALKKSCNFYFIRLGELMRPAPAVAWLKRAGFGRGVLRWPDKLTGPADQKAFGETAGHLAPLGSELPNRSELRFMSIGRGALDGSLIQVANSMATIARDGKMLAPTLIEPAVVDPGASDVIASAEAASVVQRGMHSVVYHPDGTAYDAFQPMPWPEDEVVVFGKTGSTEYSLFACFARAADGRQLALAVLVEIDAYGSMIAAPLARQILVKCSQLGYLPASHELPMDELSR